MTEAIAVALAVVVWLNSIVTIKNGGGGVSALAILIAMATVVVVIVWSLFSGNYWPAIISIVGAFSAFLVVTITPDEGVID